MIIRGNTVGTTMPRSDYAQTDPKAADYIKNKPDAAIKRAQKCADQAQETANLALEAVDAAKAEAGAYTDTAKAEAKTYTDTAKAEANSYTDSRHITKTATITTTWSGSAAPYTQVVTVSGILASDLPHITPVYSAAFATAVQQKEAWSMVNYAEAGDGKITFVCFENKPATAIPIQIEVNR